MGVLHPAEALSGAAETFDHHAAGDATEDHITAKPAVRVADVAALVLLAAVSDVQAQPRQPRPSGAPQVAALARCTYLLHACSAGLTWQPCCCSVTSPSRASAGVRLGADRPPYDMATGASSSPAEVLNKSRPARLRVAAPWGALLGSVRRSRARSRRSQPIILDSMPICY